MQYQTNSNAPMQPRMSYGGVQQPRQELIARQELFAGAQPAAAQTMQPMSVDEMNTRQLMQHAVDTHKETTASAQRSAQAVEQMKEIQGTTLQSLKEQGDQMGRIEQDMEKIGEDLSYSERILRFMRLCCCFGFFCACCTEPSRSGKDKNWRRGSGSSAQPRQSQPPQQQLTAAQRKKQQQQQQELAAHGGAAAYPGVSTNGLAEAGFGQEATVIQEETRQQDQYLDQISKGLDQLKLGAMRMNEEMRLQEATADRIGQDAEQLNFQIRNVNREGFKRI